MQGQRCSISTLPGNLSFDHGSTATDTGIDPQMSWNSIHTSAQNLIQEYRIQLCDPSVSYLRDGRHDGQSGEWSVGQTSASATSNQGEQNQRKTDHAWTVLSRAANTLEEPQHQPSNDFSTDVIRMDPNGNNVPDGFILLKNLSSGTLTRDLNMNSVYGDHRYDDCQVVEHPNTYVSIGSSSEQRVSAGGSSDSFGVPSGRGGYATRDTETRAVSLDGRRTSGKAKFEVTGQSSVAGSSSFNPHAERSQWHYIPTNPISASNATISAQAANEAVNNNGSQPSNPTLRIGVGETVSASPFSLVASGTPGSFHRHFHLHVNGSHQQDPMLGDPYRTDANVGNLDASSSRQSSRLVLCNRFLHLNPAPEAEIGNAHGQSDLLHVPSVCLNTQPLLNGASSSRTSRSNASALSGQRDVVLYEESMRRHVPRNISEHPIFVPTSESRSSSQHPTNRNFSSGNNNTAGNVSSTSLVGSSLRVNSAAPSWPRRGYPQYSRIPSDLVRGSLISSTGTDSGGPTSNPAAQPGSSALSRENAFTENHMSNSRFAYFERHVDGEFGLPYPLRSLASASEGRGVMMSEQIRRVLDLMRRGEGLRLEDVMLLDHSAFFGMADIHDRHRDMRLDVDNMSYEELLALEERIGNVCTGLTEESISSILKRHKHVDIRAENSVETEPCSICREECNEGEDVGTLECGHDFHKECIKQWLMHKNLCPICKTTGLTAK